MNPLETSLKELTEIRACVRLRPGGSRADKGLIQDYLGHRNVQHTVMDTAANPPRFQRLWG